MVQPTGVTQTGEVEQWRAKAESADHELQNMKVSIPPSCFHSIPVFILRHQVYIHTLPFTQARMEELTKELDESRKECRRKVAAFDVVNEQAQIHQQKLNEDVKKLKEKAEQMKAHNTGIYEENKNLKQIVSTLC